MTGNPGRSSLDLRGDVVGDGEGVGRDVERIDQGCQQRIIEAKLGDEQAIEPHPVAQSPEPRVHVVGAKAARAGIGGRDDS